MGVVPGLTLLGGTSRQHLGNLDPLPLPHSSNSLQTADSRYRLEPYSTHLNLWQAVYLAIAQLFLFLNI
jgi:hypothetical protein